MDALVTIRDRALIDECRNGRVDAFGELVEPYQDRLFNTLYRIVGHRDEAGDLLQEAMIRAFRGLKSYQGDSGFYTWLYRIALNVAFTRKRKQTLRVVSTEELGAGTRADLPDEDRSASPAWNMESRERQQLIQKALDAIPETYRTVMVLKDVEGLRYEAIAEILDIPIGTVRSRLHRARGAMRDLLRPMFEAGTL